MRFAAIACLAAATLAGTTVRGEDLKSGPDKKIGGSFVVEAITGANKGKSLCYV